MTNEELDKLLQRLIAGWENEVVEFKRAGDGFSTHDIGKYFSALSNETNLRDADAGWLVFGVDNKSRRVVGSDYRVERARLEGLKHDVAQGSGFSFRAIHELHHPNGRVLLFEIPPAPRGLPLGWKGFHYGRAGESLVPLDQIKLDEIRRQTPSDWTGEAVPGATIAHLDPAALARARQGFAERHSGRLSLDEIAGWDDETFLAKARLTRDGQITRAALLLLGADTSTHLLTPHAAEMTWSLVGEQMAYEHFHLPWLLNTTALVQRIRNVQLRLMPPNELIYREISKYNERSILEALYNCIAHQDYTRRSRIIVTEFVDRLEFISVGEFYDRTPEEYALDASATPRGYRNPFLVEAMTELNLIDHMGYGIHRMVKEQVRRFLPLPDYDLTSDPTEVKLTMHGAVIDEAFSQLLMVRTDLPLEDVLALDRVQKGLQIPNEAAARLRKASLIEGRKPRFHVSAAIAAASGMKAKYIRTRVLDDTHYIKLVTDYLDQFGSASRRDIDELLRTKLSEGLTDTQRTNKIGNLLTRMRRDGLIQNNGSRTFPVWIRTQ